MNILIVDDHPLVRKGISSTLSFEDNIEKIHEASNVQEAMNILFKDKPDISIIDLKLGVEDGLEIVNKAKKNEFKGKFIILTSSLKQEDFLRAQENDVDGYILKKAFVEDILYAFHVVTRGKKFFDPEILEYKIKQVENNSLDKLTPREKDVFMQLGIGLSNEQIAEKLFISECTVKKHVSSILSKLQLNHRTQAALLANKAHME